MKENINWDTYSKIISSNYRYKILTLLSSKFLSPKRISIKTKIAISHVSRALKELEQLNLIKCLTSENIKKGKIYTISENGNKYLNEIKKNLEKQKN